MNLKQALKEKWYGQGFNATPLLLGAAANSCITMKKMIGIAYSNFLYLFKGNYGDMHYNLNDLKKLGDILEDRLKKDENYLIKIREKYLEKLNEADEFYKKIDSCDLSRLDDMTLFGFLKRALKCIDISVGCAHLIEPISLRIEEKIRKELKKNTKNSKELNEIFIALTSPTKESFAKRYEKQLRQIKLQKNKEMKERLIDSTLKEFSWIRNSYAGKHILTKDELLEEINSLKDDNKIGKDKIKEEKEKIVKKLNLNNVFVLDVGAIDFLTSWQDERKENILKAIDIADKVAEAYSKKTKFEKKCLLFAAPHEIEIKNLTSEYFQEELKSRSEICVFLYDLINPIIISGENALQYIKEFQKEHNTDVEEIIGITASVGTAIGTVRVCTSISSIRNVKQGDILVASMTRPEYLPAMKKAAAIVTDEGGITCHAAIVARELGIPCIIGTKIATKVLKDGNIVEVKANHGRIIKIK